MGVGFPEVHHPAQARQGQRPSKPRLATGCRHVVRRRTTRSEEHKSELQSLMRISYAVFCLKKKTNDTKCRTLPRRGTQKPSTSQHQRPDDHNSGTKQNTSYE